jgi:hypothetical protein
MSLSDIVMIVTIKYIFLLYSGYDTILQRIAIKLQMV